MSAKQTHKQHSPWLRHLAKLPLMVASTAGFHKSGPVAIGRMDSFVLGPDEVNEFVQFT
jgi:hypothetical protein